MVAVATPLVAKYAITGGSAFVSDAADIARELVQSVYNDVVATLKPLAAIGEAGTSQETALAA